MFHGLRNLRRIWRIVRTLARHDAVSAFEPVRAHAGIRIAFWLLGRPQVPDARSRRVRDRVSEAVARLDPVAEDDALRWIEEVSDLDGRQAR